MKKVICLAVLLASTTSHAQAKKYGCTIGSTLENGQSGGGGPGKPSLNYVMDNLAEDLQDAVEDGKLAVKKQRVTETFSGFAYATVHLEVAVGTVCALLNNNECVEYNDKRITHKITITVTDNRTGQEFKMAVGADITSPHLSLNLEKHLPRLLYKPNYDLRDSDGNRIKSVELTCGEVYY